MSTFNVKNFSNLVGVSVKTLQRWDRQGKLKAGRTVTNRRFYTEDDLRKFKLNKKGNKVSVCYLRVSSQNQKPDLKNQRNVLEQFCLLKGLVIDEYIQEIGGGLNFKRPKFLNLIDRVLNNEIESVVIAHKDRLSRFGFDLVSHLFNNYGCQILVINSETLSPEQEMVQDLMTITHCFSARLYGLRNYKKALKEAINEDKQST